uniref:ubiquitinyl hydrolase 1 n=1 Tax=Meloidogyne javanica TaxID=6303 RepID=A0A915N091_MELJA
MVACRIKPNAQLYLVPETNLVLEDGNNLNNLIILQIPGEINEQLLENNLIIAVVYFVFGSVQNREIFGEPYITILNRDLGSGHLSFEIMKEGAFLLPKLFYKMNAGFTLYLQNSDGSFSRIDPIIEKPLFNEYVNNILNEKENNKKVIQIIVEWDLALKEEFKSKLVKEQIIENYSTIKNFNYVSKPVPLITLIDNFVKSEPIKLWNCPKCKKPSGSIQIEFDQLPDILVFYLNRFEKTIKNVKSVQIPQDLLDMKSYIDNGKYVENNKYNLSCVLFDSFGHYTAATRNFIDGHWRLFNDALVQELFFNNSQKEIFESANSSMFFYQRQHSKTARWFPQDVPKQIFGKYQGKIENNFITLDSLKIC